MSEVFPGRFTTRPPQGTSALFLIGMRINTFRGATKAGPVFTAMPRMLGFLSRHPESGLLGFHNWVGRTTILLSYWRSIEDVQRFASDPDAPHAAAWREFNRKIGAGPDVGIWHELFTVRPGDAEGVYVNMPAMGMAAALGHVPVAGGTRTSKQRMEAARPAG